MIAMAPPRPSRPTAHPQPAGSQQPRGMAESPAGDAGRALRHSRCKLPADLIAAARAREHVAGVVSAWRLPVDADTLDVLVLLTSELVANAITHGQQGQPRDGGRALPGTGLAGTGLASTRSASTGPASNGSARTAPAGDGVAGAEPITLSIRCRGAELRVEVHDRSCDMPVLPPRDVLVRGRADSETGRGLMLVDALADTWGYYRTPAGKAVYFTLAMRDVPPPGLARRGDGAS